MDNNSTSWQSIGIGFIFIGLIGWFSIALFDQIIHAPWQFLSIFVALLGTLITVGANYTSQIRNEHKEKKIEVYEEISECLGQILYYKIANFQEPEEDIFRAPAHVS